MSSKKNTSFQINPNTGEPIYRQLIEQINRLIISGYLQAGDELPSVRKLASDLEINPMTISKAYSMLENNGCLERRRGKGMFVSGNHKGQQSRSSRLKLLEPTMTELVNQSRQLNLSPNEILSYLSKILEAKK